ncbi:MAG TPA: NAD-dependent deacylase [bacterium]|nr:NAD-dependent deacylase [bacterium]
MTTWGGPCWAGPQLPSHAHPAQSFAMVPAADALTRAARLLAGAGKAIVLTGAGVSTESGIPDFRSATGLWSRYDPAEFATLGAFLRDPVKVWGLFAELEELLDAQPNAGHRALADLERQGALAGVITQNVDGLHQAAGSRRVVEYHGSHRTYTCLRCRQRFPGTQVRAMPKVPGTAMPRAPGCAEQAPRGGPPCLLKPDVVLFDELIPLAAQAEAAELVEQADLILVIGTSCEVYPAAEIPRQVRRAGGRVVEINLEPAQDLRPDVLLQGRFSELVPALAQAWHGLKN